MADFYNPYEYNGNKEGILKRTAKAPYRLGRAALASSPTWAPRVAAGQLVRKGQVVYRSAYDKARTVSQFRKGAYAAMKNDSGVRAAKDALFYAKRAAANRLPGLNRTVEATTRAASDAAALKRQAFSALGRTVKEGRAAIRETAARTGEAIEAGSRKLAQTAVRTVGDNSSRVGVLRSIRAGANRELSATAEGVSNAIRAAKTDTRVARGIFNTALQRKTEAVKAVNAVRAGLDRAASGVGTAINAADAARRAAISSANGGFTTAERMAMGAARSYRAAERGVGTAASKIGDVLRRAASAVKSSAIEPGLAGRIAASGKAGERVVGAGRSVAGVLGRIAGAETKTQGAVKGLGKLVAKGVTGRPIASAFNKIEAAGKLLTGSSRGLVARSIRGLTNAGGLAGGFALGAWTDAAFNIYDFYKDGGKLSDIGKTTLTTVNGKQVAQTNPGMVDIVFSADYGKEVVKGLQKALTFGLTDGEWLDNIGSPEGMTKEELAQRSRDNTVLVDEAIENMRDIHGNRVYSPEELEARKIALETSAAKSRAAQDFFRQSKGSLDVQNFQTMLGNITAERDAKLDKMEQNLRSFGDFSHTLKRPMSEEDYRKSATNAAESEFNRRVNMLLGNKTAQDVMKMNRKAAYAHYGIGSGDYDADVASATGERLEQLKMFNREWEGQSDADKVTWNVNDAKAAQAEAQAEYAETEEQ